MTEIPHEISDTGVLSVRPVGRASVMRDADGRRHVKERVVPAPPDAGLGDVVTGHRGHSPALT